MELDFQVTRGDQFYREIPFLDQYGAPVKLAGWSIEIDFKRAYTDRAAYFSLTQENGGLSFKNADPSTGILCILIDGNQFEDLDLSVMPYNGERVPFKFIYGDIKMTPPALADLVQGAGGRTSIVLKVYAGVTS